MDEEEESHHAYPRRHRLWVIGVLLVAGSCMLAIIHLSTGLHAQLLANRKMVRALKDQLIAEGEEREALLRDKDASMSKTATLRTKSKLVTEELLDQQRKARRLQQELLLAREDVQILSKNCSVATQRLRNRYEVTLRALHDRVITGEECRALLERNIEERAQLEASLMMMQDRAYNATKLLKGMKQKLRDALAIASSQRDEIIKLKRELQNFNGKLDRKSSEEGSDLEQIQSSTSHDIVDKEKIKAAWASYVDPKSGRTYWYNSILKTKAQWEKPVELE